MFNKENIELFRDHSYYDRWCVRNKEDRDFNSVSSFHFDLKKEALAFIRLLKKAS